MTDDNFLVLTHWKPYYAHQDIIPVIHDVIDNLTPDGPTLYVALCYSYLRDTAPGAIPSAAVVGADNMLLGAEGSFAEHFAANILLAANAKFVILGDSETRRALGEDDTNIAKKVASATQASLKVMLCVGETAAAHAKGQSAAVLKDQLQTCLEGLTPEQLEHVSIVYQGPWPTYFQARGLPDTLKKGLELLQNVLTDVGMHATLLVALPYQVSDIQEVVDATAPLCRGYYVSNAVSNPTLVVEVASAVSEWQKRPPEEVETAVPVEEQSETQEEVTEVQEAELPEPEETHEL